MSGYMRTKMDAFVRIQCSDGLTVRRVLSKQWGSTFLSWLSRCAAARLPCFVLYLLCFRSSRKQSAAWAVHASGGQAKHFLVSLTVPTGSVRASCPRLWRTASSAKCVVTNPGLPALFGIFIHHPR